MRRVKILLLVGIVVSVLVVGFLFFALKGREEITAPVASTAGQEEGEQGEEEDVAKADRQPGLTDTEHMSAVVSEEGVATLAYYNKTTISGAPDLVIPAEKDGLSIEDVDVLWLEADETTPVTYLKSIAWEEGIKNVEGNIDCCTALKEATIPKSVKKLPPHAFEGSADSVVLRVVKGSYGEKYAKKNGLKYEYQDGKDKEGLP